jgi:TPR repeat protein
MDSELQAGRQVHEPATQASGAREWNLHPGQRQHSDAAFKLANWHLTAQEIGKALRWYERAANAGHVRAQYNLGLLYLKGEHVPWDGFTGTAWISKAAKNGDAKAQALLQRLRNAPVKVKRHHVNGP